jgi:hypothetical protein
LIGLDGQRAVSLGERPDPARQPLRRYVDPPKWRGIGVRLVG